MRNVLARQSVTACDDRFACNGKNLIVLCCAACDFHVMAMFFIEWQHSLQGTLDGGRYLSVGCLVYGVIFTTRAVAGEDLHSGIICNLAGNVL